MDIFIIEPKTAFRQWLLGQMLKAFHTQQSPLYNLKVKIMPRKCALYIYISDEINIKTGIKAQLK